MARHHDRLIADAKAVAAEVGKPPRRTDPRTPEEIDKFLRGFGLSTAAVKQVREAWQEDARLSYASGYDQAEEDITSW